MLVCSLSIPSQTVTDNLDTSDQHALSIWRAIKRQLLAPDGLEYWQQSIKNCLIPGGADGVKRFTGFVIKSTPTEHPTTLDLGIIDETVSEVELRFVDRNRRGAYASRSFPVGTKVHFQGVSIDYVSAPFRVTFEADSSWVTPSKSRQ